MDEPDDDLATFGAPNCPRDLVPMHAEGDDPDGRDAHWVCPACGLVRLT